MNDYGKGKFDSCAHRSVDVVVELLKRCDGCPPKHYTGYKCLKKIIFPLGYINCEHCEEYQNKERDIEVL